MVGNEPLEGDKLEVAVSASGALQYSVFLLLEKVRSFALWVGGSMPGIEYVELTFMLQDPSLEGCIARGTASTRTLVQEQSTSCAEAAQNVSRVRGCLI